MSPEPYVAMLRVVGSGSNPEAIWEPGYEGYYQSFASDVVRSEWGPHGYLEPYLGDGPEALAWVLGYRVIQPGMYRVTFTHAGSLGDNTIAVDGARSPGLIGATWYNWFDPYTGFPGSDAKVLYTTWVEAARGDLVTLVGGAGGAEIDDPVLTFEYLG